MRKILTTIYLVLGISASWAQTYSSDYLLDPELLIDYVEDCANFWIGVEDETNGAFYTSVGRTGNVLSSDRKGMVSLSRDAYGFARAFMLTGNELYLDKARSALQFMYDHMWDETNGGWHTSTKSDGTNPSGTTRYAFDQHYALLGISAMLEATGDSMDWEMLNRGYDYIEAGLWDDDGIDYGYYHRTNQNSTLPNFKSFNSTVDAVTTHQYPLYLLTGEQRYEDRLQQLKRNMIDRLIGSMADQAIGFAEHYNTNWTVNESEDRTIMGHVLKTGWCLARIYRMSGETEALDGAITVIQDVLDKGYDHTNGGPFKDYKRRTGEMMFYGAQDTAKAWWQMEQAITSGLLLFEITWDPKYLKMADESLQFFMQYFVDPVYGEVYADRSKDGGRVRSGGGFWDENKGSDFKAGYHSIETGYYAYIYGKLLIRQEPVTLYYRYSAEENDRTLRYNPVAADFDRLSILTTTFNGEPWALFDSTNRMVTIPADSAGILAVTFGYDADGQTQPMPQFVSAVAENNLEADLYPNPATNVVQINLPVNSKNIKAEISDQSGRLMQALNTAESSFTIDVSELPAGIYMARFLTDEGSAVKKLVVVE